MKKVVFSLLLAFVCLPVAFAQIDAAPYFQRIDKTVCGSYTWSLTGETYTTDTAVMVLRNDTAYALFLSMAEPTYDTAVTRELSGNCSVTFRDSVFTTAGTFDAVMPTASGCDSIVRLSITLTGVDSTDQTVTACDSLVAPWGEVLRSSVNTVKDTTVNGCLRHDVLNLTINNSFHGETLEVTANCSYTWQGMVITDTNVHTKRFSTSGGCDSILSVRVTSFDNHNINYDTAVACAYYIAWDTLRASGDYSHNDTAGECVTTTNLHLTINPVYTDTTNITVENIAAGCYVDFAGQRYTDTNVVHYGILTTAAGCDSVAAIRIISYTDTQYVAEDVQFCGNRYPWGKDQSYGWIRYIANPVDPNATSLEESDTIVTADTTVTVNGCTYQRHLNLQFVHVYEDTTRMSGCESVTYSFIPRVNNGYEPNDKATFTVSGVYTKDTNNVELYSRHFQTKCVTHHIVKVNILTPEQHLSDTLSFNECDKFTFRMSRRDADSATFTADTLYTRVRAYRTTMQCYDTIIPMHIKIRHSSFDTTVVVTCDTFTWAFNETLYTNSIITRKVIEDTVNSQGCDSVGLLNLTINRSPEVYIDGNWVLEPGDVATLNAVCTMPGVTYAWYKGTSTTPASTTASLTVEPEGMENVDIHLVTTKKYGSESCVTNNWITVTTNVGIDDVDALQVNIYPNPTSRILNIQSVEGISNIVIYNTIGQQVMMQNGNNDHMQLDLGNLASGNYTLCITGANGEQTTRKINIVK